ncbi:hypothetical protein EXIGLDRAFT_804699 [Exidia glandulosa HHB12029]|uniref:Uncharacterized protein n=1 Tax=Exidia glandulosa HHB12029 TaxID=1314781 RepID=A0A165ME26_EXIGL|nr:hypothetical protein EXIGLDRAFT_804699 [Exidia glandulosa HHB12029]
MSAVFIASTGGASPNLRQRSPKPLEIDSDKCFAGQTEHGVYVDDCEGVHPDAIQEYYGADEDEAEREAADDNVEHADIAFGVVAGRVRKAQAGNVHNSDSAKVPATASPIENDTELAEFMRCFQEVRDTAFIPHGFGLHEDEFDGDYPAQESIPYGKRGTRELMVDLPQEVWYPRAVLWAQAVYTLARLFPE